MHYVRLHNTPFSQHAVFKINSGCCMYQNSFIFFWAVFILCREGNGNPLQYSCLENPIGRGAWWATVHGVAQRWAPLERNIGF